MFSSQTVLSKISYVVKALVAVAIACIIAFSFTGCGSGTSSNSTNSASSSTSSSSTSNSSSSSSKSLEISAADAQAATVVKIVDGDTLSVKINGKTKKVRLIGVDCPESVAADELRNCEEGRMASDYTKSLVSVGSTVYLTQDVSDTDQYDRLLRFVWLEKPSANPTEDEAKSKMLNAILLVDGYAQAKTYKPDTTLSSFFSKLGKEALSAGAGVSYKWA